jgi:hypothetical protein
MREVANLSARAAIDGHARRTLLRMSSGKLVGVVLSLLCSGAMIWMWLYFGAGELTFYTGLVGLLIALSWAVQYAMLTGRLIVSRSGRVQWKWHKGSAGSPPPPPAENPEGREDREPGAES